MRRIHSLTTLPAETVYDRFASPVGTLWLFASDLGLHAIFWDVVEQDDRFIPLLASFRVDAGHTVIQQAKQELQAYFLGQRHTFSVPLAIEGTDFQKQAWQALQAIPYGETRTYGEQAAWVGDKKKARAIGMANNANPVPIMIPCHRVVGAKGQLVGFGGGVDKKAFLLKLESQSQ